MAVRVLAPPTVAPPLGLYSHAAEAAGLVVVAGQVGFKPDGALAGLDVASQTQQALANIQAILAAAGCDMQDVIRFQTFLTSAEDIPGFMTARAEAFPRYFPDGAYPPNTLVVVSRLVRPELRVEIEAMAVRRAAAPPGAARRRAAARRGRAPAPAAGRRSRTRRPR